MPSGDPETILTLNDVTKGLYDVSGHTISRDVIVLKSVSFNVRRGEVHILLGENGAGKSTLMKILCGAIPADSGEIHLHGKKVNIDRPSQAQDLGVSLVAQEFNLCPNLTAAQSICLGREPVRGPFSQIDTRKMNEEAQAQLNRLGVNIDARTLIKDLTVPQRQIVEIAKALSLNPSILVMDEPTAALADDQVDRLFDIIRELTRQGVSIIYISHRLNELTRIGDRATVLRDGQTVGTENIGDVSLDKLVHMMVGRTITSLYTRDKREPGALALEVNHLTRNGVLRDITLQVRCGEIVGLAGIVGAGRTELARAIFGVDPIDSGEIRVFGELVKAHSPRSSIQLGVGLLPEDRQRQGVVPLVSVADNMVHVAMRELATRNWLTFNKRRETAATYIHKLDMAVSSTDQEARFLSGGTQQKLVLGKWLLGKSKLFIFDEPTRGIDVGAKAAIHALMNDLANQGAAILMISSELPEILGMSDRIYVMNRGHIVAERLCDQTSSEEILGFAVGKQDVQIA